MHADRVALGRVGHGADHRSPLLGIARAPFDCRGGLAALQRMGVQSDVSHVLSRCQRAGKRRILAPVDEFWKTSRRRTMRAATPPFLGRLMLIGGLAIAPRPASA